MRHPLLRAAAVGLLLIAACEPAMKETGPEILLPSTPASLTSVPLPCPVCPLQLSSFTKSWTTRAVGEVREFPADPLASYRLFVQDDGQASTAIIITLNGETVVGEADLRVEGVREISKPVPLKAGNRLVVRVYGAAQATVKVWIEPVIASLQLTPAAAFLEVGRDSQLVALPIDVRGQLVATAPVTWTSLDPGTATVTTSGMVSGVSLGAARIVASSGGKSDTSTVEVAVTLNGLAAALTGDPEVPMIMTHTEGTTIEILADPSAPLSVSSIRGFVYRDPTGSVFTMYLGSDGMPEKLVFGNQVVLFANWAASTVDVALIDANGRLGITRQVAVDPNLIAGLRNAIAGGQQGGLRRGFHGANLIGTSWSAVLSFAGLAVGAAGCATAVIVTVGAATPIALACGALVVNVAITLLAPNNPTLTSTSTGVGLVLGAWGCGGGNVISCAAMGINFAKTANILAQATIQQNQSVVGGATAALTATGIAVMAGNNQSGTTGSLLSSPLQVRVTGPGGGGVAGVPVTFTVNTGGGTVASTTNGTFGQVAYTLTDQMGVATAYWKVGTSGTSNTVVAAFTGLVGNAAFFSATATSSGTPVLVYSDDFSHGLNNWVIHNPDGFGSWTIQNNELLGDYNIGCGYYTCYQTQLILADNLQPGTGNWRIEVQSGLVQAYCCYNGGAIGNLAKFALYFSDSQKEAIDIGMSWQGTVAPPTTTTAYYAHQSYPWVQLAYQQVTVPQWSPAGWQTAALEKIGTTYTLYFNGQPLYQFSRNFATPPKVGFSTYGQVRMDNFKLYRLP